MDDSAYLKALWRTMLTVSWCQNHWWVSVVLVFNPSTRRPSSGGFLADWAAKISNSQRKMSLSCPRFHQFSEISPYFGFLFFKNDTFDFVSDMFSIPINSPESLGSPFFKIANKDLRHLLVSRGIISWQKSPRCVQVQLFERRCATVSLHRCYQTANKQRVSLPC